MHSDPRDILLKSPMTWMQVIIIAITIGLNGLDGFDVLSISYASPGIMGEWGIDRGVLGLVLVAELVGMAIGSIFLGGVADKIGRRPLMLGCLVLMAVGMIMVTTIDKTTGNGLALLSAWRVVTGLGIGGMLAAVNAVAAEFANAKNKHLSVSLMSIGYPAVGAVGGLIASWLLQSHDWRAVFYFGCATTVVFIPIVFFLIPESVHWLARKQPAGALEKINRAMRLIGKAAIAALPHVDEQTRKRSVMDVFRPGLIATTLICAAAYFFHITTFYYILKWVPNIVVEMGFPPSSAGGVLTWYMAGGATGGAVLGLLTMRFGLKGLTIAVLVLSTVLVGIFGQTPADLSQLGTVCFFAGFFTNAGIVGLYAIIAQAFPTHVRASGTGFAIGVGRGGSVLAPIIAGYLFQFGFSLPTVSFALGAGSIVGAVMVLLLKLEDKTAEEAGVPQPAQS